MRTVLIGIARMGSSRLPGKVLMDLGGKPVIEWIADAGRNATLVDDVIIATTTDPRDNAIEDWCKENSVECFRGSEDDVLDRFCHAAERMNAEIAVRVTCDCPFIDPHVIDQVIALREATNADYASNIDPPTWPDGLDCEAIAIPALKAAYSEAKSKIDRECVTCWITRNRYRFKCETLICPLPGMHKERWVLDTQADYEFCKQIANSGGLYSSPDWKVGRQLGWLEIKRFLDTYPELRKINAHHPRNERYFAALAEEPIVPRSYTNSQKLLKRAEDVIPLGTQTFSKSKIQYPSDSPLFVTHGDGGYCFDVDGNRYVDLVGGLLPVILGHRDPDIDYAVARQQRTRGVCFSLATELEAQLAETLCRLIPCAEWARFGKNGTDVTSAAVRLARAHTGRDYILSSGYHGWADWAIANDFVRNLGVTSSNFVWAMTHGKFEPPNLLPPFGPNNWAGVIVEPETNPEFLKECRKFCDDTGALLIFDEIITGFRFGLGGAQKLYGITPDIACFGKSMANGYPISCIVGKKEYYDTMAKICFSGTFFGDPIALTAAIATIEKMERENVLSKIIAMQRLLIEQLRPLTENQDAIAPIGNIALPRLQFKNNDIKTLFIQEMAQAGVLIIASHNLMYAHGPDEIRRIVRAYEHTLPILADAIKKGDVKERIKGRPIPAYANVRATS